MPIMLPARAALASQYAAQAPYVSLLSALTLQANASAGGTSVSVDLAVAAGDVLVFDRGQATEETRTITAVSGTAPYVATVAALSFPHATSSYVSHLPNASGTVHELAVTRTSASWGAVSGSTVNAAPSPINVGQNLVVGAVSLHSAVSAGTYYDASAVACQKFATAGTYQPTYSETVS